MSDNRGCGIAILLSEVFKGPGYSDFILTMLWFIALLFCECFSQCVESITSIETDNIFFFFIFFFLIAFVENALMGLIVRIRMKGWRSSVGLRLQETVKLKALITGAQLVPLSAVRSLLFHCPTLRAPLSGTFLQTLPDLVTPLKGHSLHARNCPATRSGALIMNRA